MKPRPNKYGAKRTTTDGIEFASAKEARRYGALKILEVVGEISCLEVQPRFDFVVAGVRVGRFTLDFAYRENDRPVVEDVKGGNATKTEAYRLRVRLFRALYPHIELREV
jgi:hypothetical protein